MQLKMSWVAGISLVAVGVLLTTYAGYELRKMGRESVRNEVTEQARGYSAQIQAEVQQALDAARTMARVFSSQKKAEAGSRLTREQVNEMLVELLLKNPQFLGTYVCWEPNAFDGKDSEQASKPGHDGTGRFIPYWTRTPEGKPHLEPLVDYEKPGAGDYYLIPKSTKRETIIDPYVYNVQGKEVLMTSVVVPIIINDTFYGMTGVDLSLDFLQSFVEERQKVLPNSTILIISHSGLLAAATGRRELLGKSAEAFHGTDFKEDLTEIQAGREISAINIGTEEEELETFIPIRFGQTNTPWSFNILTPINSAFQKINSLIAKLVLIAVLCLVAGVLAMIRVTRQLSQPLVETEEHINQSGERLLSAALQLETNSQQLAENANQQAATIEEASASLEEMLQTSKLNTDHAQQAKNQADQALKVMQSSIVRMDELRQAVEAVHSSTDEMKSAMDEIKNSSGSIAKIIKTIDEIAFQTNILALNAAVEAARAGEAGAGFAVVADEVRNLAQRAANAARETANLIEDSIKKSDHGVHVNQSVIGHLQAIAHKSQQVDHGLAQISEAVSSMDKTMLNISTASHEQAVGVDQINLAVRQIDQITQASAAMAEETAGSAQELHTLASELKKDVLSLHRVVLGG